MRTASGKGGRNPKAGAGPGVPLVFPPPKPAEGLSGALRGTLEEDPRATEDTLSENPEK